MSTKRYDDEQSNLTCKTHRVIAQIRREVAHTVTHWTPAQIRERWPNGYPAALLQRGQECADVRRPWLLGRD